MIAGVHPLVPPPLPAALTPFTGRKFELAAAADLILQSDVRLLTLTGPGGVGKTRLAGQIARDMAARFPDSVWFVPLAAVSDASQVPAEVAAVFGVRETGERSLNESLLAFLRPRQLLLVLDNFEQVVGATSWLAQVLIHCPEIKALVTSRIRLGIAGEHVFPVLPLTVPPPVPLDPAELMEFDAVDFFRRRAEAVDPAFSLTPENAPVVAALCRQLEGLPLALELAAAWLRIVPLSSLGRRLQPRLPLLTRGGQDQADRFTSMRATIAWSYDLLREPEQRLFRQLAVFTGGCTIEAAVAIAGPSAILDGSAATDEPGCRVLKGIAALVDASLLQRAATVTDDDRVIFLETIREFGWEQLRVCGELAEAQRRHAAYFRQLAERASPELRGPELPVWLARLRADEDNLRAAFNWLEAVGEAEAAIRLAVDVAVYWHRQGRLAEGREWLDRALKMPAVASASASVRAAALEQLAHLAANAGDHRQAVAAAEAGLALAQASGDRGLLAKAYLFLGIAAMEEADLLQRAEWACDLAISLFRELKDEVWIPTALGNRGVVALLAEDLTYAACLFDESLTLERARGHRWGIARSLLDTGDAALLMGDRLKASAAYVEALRLCHAEGDQTYMALSLSMLAVVIPAPPLQQARLLGVAARLRAQTGFSLMRVLQAPYAAMVDRLRVELGAGPFAAAWAEGEALALEDALALVTKLMTRAPAKPHRVADEWAELGLTPREVEILRLLASGASNQAIAETLFIGRGTVKTHVSSILAKLNLSSRTAAMALAHSHGLGAE